MNGAANQFAQEQKSGTVYLDVATNDHGDEKGMLVHRALSRIENDVPHIVEIGPGGGAAVEYLTDRLVEGSRTARLTLIEAPGVVSQSLLTAMDRFNTIGSSALVHGWAQDIASLLDEPVDMVSASALLHEIYSYGDAYTGLHSMMRILPTVIQPYGYFVYRDVYAVDAPSLHERVVQSYSRQAWLQFLRMFLPHYLATGAHPYHHHADEVVVRQNSRIVPLAEVDTRVCAVIEAPIGVFREVQRHYITFRDHVWRSGVLGFHPSVDGPLSQDWIDFRFGHKRVHYSLSDSGWMSSAQRANLLAVSERFTDHYVIDGDLFDAMSDVSLMAFLASAERDDRDCAPVWESWLTREGRETYAYLTIDELLSAFAVNSIEAGIGQDSVLMPVSAEDVFTRERRYYNRFLTKRLSNPLTDAKQLVLFQNIPVADAEAVQRGLGTLHRLCSKPNLARVQGAIHWRE
ncbi:hypothetical protein DFR76_10559 [Nocardia pseudobrasiliensis]|uniref:Methyltransferase family protein n=2 Tax=Nocardia pseudobrasiliensis TaxID=45979 RepID=A0A370I8M4_9NOCA|nr:hypothetical protein DFR76_10559 [Nocardia pseudobrasiliensis]